jgi:hypothetical protein
VGQIIKFIAQDENVWEVRPKPYPSIKKLPSWWKDMPIYSNEEKTYDLGPAPTVTVKKCLPTLDMFGGGYYVPLWADIFVTQEGGLPYIKWNTTTTVLTTWDTGTVNSFKIEDGYSKLVFKNLHGWTIKTPPGWSCLFLHPAAYPDLPFKVIPGIVDTDVLDYEINTPFVVKEGFTGTIEKGTPMFQVIPFKRESWKSEFSVKKPNQHFFDHEKLYSKIHRAYASMTDGKKKYT